MSRTFDRRRFLLGTAGATIALPWLPSLFASGSARAAAAAPPKRFVGFFTPLGSRPDAWDGPVGALTSLPEPLAPLASHASDILLLEGINYSTTYGGTQYGGAHQRGIGCILTGYTLQSGSFGGGNGAPLSGFANGPSLDQFLAQRLGGSTAFSNIALGVQNDADALPNIARMCFERAGVPVPAVEDPQYAFDRIFAGLPTDGKPSAVLLQKKSVLDGAVAEFTALGPSLAAEDRLKLEAHLSEIRDLETQLENLLTAPSCSAGTRPGTLDLKSNASYPALGELQMKLLVKALQCDLTRVGTLQWSRAGSNTVHTWASKAGLNITDTHHNISHVGSTEPGRSMMIAINQWYAARFSTFLDLLKAVPEADGTTLLDHCAVLWSTELSDGDRHTRTDVPTVLAGKCSGAFKPGRCLRYTNAPNNEVLASVANAMGVTVAGYGDPAYPGLLTGLNG